MAETKKYSHIEMTQKSLSITVENLGSGVKYIKANQFLLLPAVTL